MPFVPIEQSLIFTLHAPSQDGAHFERDNAMIRKIVALLQAGVHVGVVTAAGYPGEAARFEGRLKGLLVRRVGGRGCPRAGMHETSTRVELGLER
jgi:hypothetical protein